jgi:hypothetical protein
MTRASLIAGGLVAALGACAPAPAVAGRESRVPAVVSAPGAGVMSLTEAQERASFVICLPTAVPADAGTPRILFAPAQQIEGVYVPDRVYIAWANGMTLWQMPSLGQPLTRPSFPLRFGDRAGWAAQGPGPRRVTVEWIQGDTQLGLAAELRVEELLKLAGSATQAAPGARMGAPSAARRRGWGRSVAADLPGGGVGLALTPGMPTTILSVEPGMPAARAGLRPGDTIVAADGRDVSPLHLPAMMELLRGAPGTPVKLTVARAGSTTPLQVTLKRVRLPLYDVEEMTLAQARAVMPFVLLTPQWLPPGYGLLTVSALTRNGKPVQARLLYAGAGKPLLIITQAGARSTAGPAPAPGLGARVAIGAATGTLTSAGAQEVLSWTRGETAVSLQSRALGREAMLKTARSMR